jgi:methionyl-tRNA formyltransferase
MTNVLLIGLGITTYSALQSLLDECNVQAIIRVTDLSNANDPVITLAQQKEIPVFTDISQTNIESLILKFQPDCVVVSSYNQILLPSLIQLSTFINVHYSPLPKYRGRANVNWALINDESQAAITIHKITSELDEGNILFQESIQICFDDTVADIYNRLNEIQQKCLGNTVLDCLNGEEGVPQNNAEATYCSTRLPEDSEINWSASTRSIDCFVRALVSPFPFAYTYFQGEKMLIVRAKSVDSPPYVGRIPGRIVGRSKKGGYIDVLTGDGILRIYEVKFEGQENNIPAASAIKSVKSTLGLKKSDLLSRIQALEEEIIRLKEYEK